MVIQQYQDPSVGKWLKLGYWYQEHKIIIIKSFIGVLIAINVIFWVNTFFNVYKLVQSSKYEDQLYSELVQNRIQTDQLHQALAPQNIEISQISAIAGVAAKVSNAQAANIVDLIAYANNLNDNWTAKITYAFSANSITTVERTAYLLPQEQVPLIGLGLPGPLSVEDADITVSIAWHRVKDKDIEAVDKAQTAKNNITVSSVNITAINGYTDARVQVENTGAYDIASSDIVAVLSRAGVPYAVGLYQSEKLKAGQSAEIILRLQHAIPYALEAEAFPQLDFLDDSIYSIPSSKLDFRL